MSEAHNEIFTPQRRQRRVPWAFKDWDDFTESDKAALAQHMKTFETPEQSQDYAKYLINHCGVPKEVFN